VVGVADISRAILVLRGHRVLLDEETKVLIQSVRRNRARFPPDFMFQLTASEWAGLRSQVVTSKRGGRRYAPHAFTEQGVAMLASVLGSDRAIAVNIQIMRAFVRMRELLISNRALADKLDQLEARLERKLTTHDAAIAAILSAIRELMRPTPPRRLGIGFTADLDEK
jgi:ORF6N domain